LLESARKKTEPHKVDWYEVFCAVLYLLRSSYQWRMLPDSFPKWPRVHTIVGMEIEFDPDKVARNLKKHGVRFELRA
jgi:transposase